MFSKKLPSLSSLFNSQNHAGKLTIIIPFYRQRTKAYRGLKNLNKTKTVSDREGIREGVPLLSKLNLLFMIRNTLNVPSVEIRPANTVTILFIIKAFKHVIKEAVLFTIYRC